MTRPPTKLIRVLVADDSLVVRTLMGRLIDGEPDMVCVGEASNGAQIVERARKLRPDLITMDVTMPRLDGVEATRQIMSTCPVPIVIVTAQPVGKGTETTFRAMAAGAVDVLPKPGNEVFGGPSPEREQFIGALRCLSRVGVLTKRDVDHYQPPPGSKLPSVVPAVKNRRAGVIAVGASTGGPPCVRSILDSLNSRTCPPVLLTQHMSENFVPGFVSWLDSSVSLPVQMATNGALLVPGRVYVAPGGAHMSLGSRTTIRLDQGPLVNFQRPSVDVLFSSVARHFGADAVGVILTGMGKDGAQGLSEIHDAGGLTLAQDEASSLVYGMPRAAYEMGAVQGSLAPCGIAQVLRRIGHAGGDVRSTSRRRQGLG